MAGSIVGEAWVAVGAQTDKVDDQVVEAFTEAGKKGAKAFDSSMDKATKDSDGPAKARGAGLGTTFAASFAGAFSAQGAFTAIKGFTDAAAESQKIAKLTEATIKSTGGAAGVTAKDVDKLADALSRKSGIDDEAIKSGQNLLLQFKDIRNGVGEDNKIFDRTSTLMVDMAAKMGVDASAAAKTLGKALNEPGQGLTRLRAAGVEFTKEQEDQIEAMNASGDVAGAQKAILDALEVSYGGAAEAAATSADKQKVAWGNVQEEIGAKLLPVLAGLTGFIVDIMIPALSKFFDFLTQPDISISSG